MPYKSPFRGQRGIGSKKAQRPKRFRKDKSAESSREKKARKPRSPWGLFGAVASFAAVWAIAVFRMQADSKQKRLSDNLLLKTLLSRPMIYTDHAICRMKCRFITEDDVDESLNSGKINSRKSVPGLLPCPKYVVDAKVGDSLKNIETVFAACPTDTKVITVIDQDRDWECYCP